MKNIPAEIRSVFGKRVTGAWLYPGRAELLLRFDQQFLSVSAKTVRDQGRALSFELGDAKPDATFEDLDKVMIMNWYARALIGLRFHGIDCDVLEFEGRRNGLVGAKIQPHGVEWVRER